MNKQNNINELFNIKFKDEFHEKFIALFVLYGLGDTIGFKNGHWEFNYSKAPSVGIIFELISEFINYGGVNGIILEKWLISDDTIYHEAIAKSLLEYNDIYKLNDTDSNEEFITLVKTNMISAYNRIENDSESNINRYPGITTTQYVKKFIKNINVDGRTLRYDSKSGSNGAAMRNLCIGLIFFHEEQLDILINISINMSKLTHNSPLGFLAGFTSAYFVSLAVRQEPLENWVFLLIDLLKSKKIKKYIDFNNNDIINDYLTYIRHWTKYLNARFRSNDRALLRLNVSTNLIYRMKFYYEYFTKDTGFNIIGESGFCSMIMAYDALVDCDGIWEKNIFYSMLHPGDSDTVGAIASGLFGIVFGFSDVPVHMFEHLEDLELLIELGDKYYNKFFLSH